MPHCWPQKQQCVFTSRSSSDSWVQPPGGVYFKVGPNLSFNASGLGALATRRLLDPQLRTRKRLALACWTQRLPMPSGARHGVIEAHLRQDAAQVLDVHPRREPLSAARADGACIFGSGLLI